MFIRQFKRVCAFLYHAVTKLNEFFREKKKHPSSAKGKTMFWLKNLGGKKEFSIQRSNNLQAAETVKMSKSLSSFKRTSRYLVSPCLKKT